MQVNDSLAVVLDQIWMVVGEGEGGAKDDLKVPGFGNWVGDGAFTPDNTGRALGLPVVGSG